MKEFVKATVIGGVLFLLPATVVLLILSHAMRLAGKVAVPVSHSLQLDSLGNLAGASAATVIAVIVLIVVSFSAGLIARTEFGTRMANRLENSILGGLPQYQMIKSMAEGLAHVETVEGVKPVLISIEDGWQFGYLLEEVGNGWVGVFLPQAPTLMSGNIMFLPARWFRPWRSSRELGLARPTCFVELTCDSRLLMHNRRGSRLIFNGMRFYDASRAKGTVGHHKETKVCRPFPSVRFWPLTDIGDCTAHVRFRGQSGDRATELLSSRGDIHMGDSGSEPPTIGPFKVSD
jgi:uncharacterized membrane protein